MSIIVAGPPSKMLAYSTAKLSSLECIDVSTKRFPDGEIKITIDDASKLEDKHVIIIHSTNPPVNDNLIQLLLILGKVREHTSKITIVIPYLSYARQDREFLKGESVSINHISNILDVFLPRRIITIDIHSQLALSYLRRCVNLTAVPLLAEWFKGKDVIVVSPDIGGRERAELFASFLKSKVVVLPKYRDRVTGEVKIDEDSSILNEVEGREVIIVDDMISTGASIIKASSVIKNRCKEIYTTCTHALLLNNAYEKIIDAGVRDIIATNTIENIASKVDVSPLISNAIKE